MLVLTMPTYTTAAIPEIVPNVVPFLARDKRPRRLAATVIKAQASATRMSAGISHTSCNERGSRTLVAADPVDPEEDRSGVRSFVNVKILDTASYPLMPLSPTIGRWIATSGKKKVSRAIHANPAMIRFSTLLVMMFIVDLSPFRPIGRRTERRLFESPLPSAYRPAVGTGSPELAVHAPDRAPARTTGRRLSGRRSDRTT